VSQLKANSSSRRGRLIRIDAWEAPDVDIDEDSSDSLAKEMLVSLQTLRSALSEVQEPLGGLVGYLKRIYQHQGKNQWKGNRTLSKVAEKFGLMGSRG
jgi:hypothetical protein